MGGKLRAFSRYRPRLVTLFALGVIAATLALANLTSDIESDLWLVSRAIYGWPLRWHWHTSWQGGIHSWGFSASRLAANMVLWLLLLGILGAACEWLLRRHRPRFRWSLRSMLAATTLLAACCAWFATAHHRAYIQDRVAAEESDIWWTHWGPKWLEFLGARRLRRQIAAARLWSEGGDDDARIEELLRLLARWSRVKFLFFHVEKLTPRMVASLGKMPQLRVLSIEADRGVSPECLSIIGKMSQLEALQLAGRTQMDGGTMTSIAAESLVSLGRLERLKHLNLERASAIVHEMNRDSRLIGYLPPLAQLQTLNLDYAEVGDDDLRCLSAFPRLRSLSLAATNVTRTGLARLAPLEALEELAIDGEMVSAAGLQSLLRLRLLKKLHIVQRFRSFRFDLPFATLHLDNGSMVYVPEDEADGCQIALQALRRSKPKMVIDTNHAAVAWSHYELVPDEYVRGAGPYHRWLPALGTPWLTPAEKAAADAWMRKAGLQLP